MTQEKFHIPAVAGIVENTKDGKPCVLIQERQKKDLPKECGLLEIPGGKIREFENIFHALKREVFEETGVTVTEVIDNNLFQPVKDHGYHVTGYEPFYTAQNITGSYPIMVLIFRCLVKDDSTWEKSDESKNIRWLSIMTLYFI